MLFDKNYRLYGGHVKQYFKLYTSCSGGGDIGGRHRA
jgi:hypothetical protein